MILHIGRVILVIFEVLVIFNLLIVVHEIGHFLAARWRGLYVEKFGVWFGKPLWKKKIDGVQYSLGSLPFGGFVALPQLAPMDIIEGKADVDRAHLPPVSALDKIIVAVAGPFFSLLLAIVFAAIVWIVGYPVSESDTTTVVGYIMPDSPAEKVGLRPGDKILEVDGKRVTRFLGMNDSVSWAVVRSEGETVPVKNSSATDKCKRSKSSPTKPKRGAGAEKVFGNCSSCRRKRQLSTKSNQTRPRRPPACARVTSFADSITHRSTIRSRSLSTLKNILTKHWRSRWSAVVRGSKCR